MTKYYSLSIFFTVNTHPDEIGAGSVLDLLFEFKGQKS